MPAIAAMVRAVDSLSAVSTARLTARASSSAAALAVASVRLTGDRVLTVPTFLLLATGDATPAALVAVFFATGATGLAGAVLLAGRAVFLTTASRLPATAGLAADVFFTPLTGAVFFAEAFFLPFFADIVTLDEETADLLLPALGVFTTALPALALAATREDDGLLAGAALAGTLALALVGRRGVDFLVVAALGDLLTFFTTVSNLH